MGISSGLSRDLAQGFDKGELDLVLVKQRRNSRQAVHCRHEPMHWIDSLRSSCLQQDPLPLVTFPPRGLYRDEMIHVMREARLYLGEGGIDVAGILRRIPRVPYSIELPHLGHVHETGYAEHAFRCLETAKAYLAAHEAEFAS